MIDETNLPRPRQEPDRIPPATILLVFALVGFIGVLLVVWAWYGLEKRERALRPTGVFPESTLGPRRTVHGDLENIYGDMGPGQRLNEEKRRLLASFQWTDRGRRIVAIPIDDAIDLMLAGGPP
jgi:hypothetical protein